MYTARDFLPRVSAVFTAITITFTIICLTAQSLFSQELISRLDRSDNVWSLDSRREELLKQKGDHNSEGSSFSTAQKAKLDKRIDPDVYVVGPGDELSLFIWGTVNESYRSSVGYEGNIVIPKVGVLQLGGKTMSEVRTHVKDTLRSVYRDAEVSVLLSNIREFKVYVLGQVKSPGAYEVNAATRISDVIARAGGTRGMRSMRRNIEIKGRDSVAPEVDLPLFYHSNIRKKNPYLREGDRIFVHPAMHYLSITGAVNYPGTYDFLPGDSLGTLLDVAGGLARGADSTRLSVTRFVTPEGDSTSTIGCSLPGDRDMILKKDDRVHVYSIPEYRIARKVVVTGEVMYPGVYPIKKDRTTLQEIVEMAGGFTDEAFLEGASVDRQIFNDFSTQDVNKLLEVLRVTQVDPTYVNPSDLSYIKSKIMESEGNLSVDISSMFNGGGKIREIIMRDQDSIHVPRMSLNVKVTGAVVNPGLVRYKKGASHLYYIERAGGFLRDARRRSVQVGKVRTGKGVWLDPGKVDKISPGDVVFVPERIQRDQVVIVKDYLTIISSITTIGISLYTILNSN